MSKSNQKRFSRRGFCKTAVAMPVLLPGINLLDQQPQGQQSQGQQPQGRTERRPSAPTQPEVESDFTRQSAALQPDKVVDSACQFCNSLCRLKVQMKSGRVIDILGEPDDPVQAGNFCVKGPMMVELAYNRHRLTTPLKRVAGEKGS